jgi:hypothetical protein
MIGNSPPPLRQQKEINSHFRVRTSLSSLVGDKENISSIDAHSSLHFLATTPSGFFDQSVEWTLLSASENDEMADDEEEHSCVQITDELGEEGTDNDEECPWHQTDPRRKEEAKADSDPYLVNIATSRPPAATSTTWGGGVLTSGNQEQDDEYMIDYVTDEKLLLSSSESNVDPTFVEDEGEKNPQLYEYEYYDDDSEVEKEESVSKSDLSVDGGLRNKRSMSGNDTNKKKTVEFFDSIFRFEKTAKPTRRGRDRYTVTPVHIKVHTLHTWWSFSAEYPPAPRFNLNITYTLRARNPPPNPHHSMNNTIGNKISSRGSSVSHDQQDLTSNKKQRGFLVCRLAPCIRLDSRGRENNLNVSDFFKNFNLKFKHKIVKIDAKFSKFKNPNFKFRLTFASVLSNLDLGGNFRFFQQRYTF